MTMSHLMNCSHSEEGWCLACVKSLHDVLEVTAAGCVLTRVQAEIAEWAQGQFGDNPSQHPVYDGAKLFSIPPFLGMVEELGELAGPQAKRHQGRYKHDDTQYQVDIRDGLGDLLIFACDFARREGISLAEVLYNTWETVKQRRQASWNADKAKEAVKTSQNLKESSRTKKSPVQTELDRLASIADARARGEVSEQAYENAASQIQDVAYAAGFTEAQIHSQNTWADVVAMIQSKSIPSVTLAEVSNLDLTSPSVSLTQDDIALTQSFGDGVGTMRSLDHSYNRFCGTCHKVPIHHTNTSGNCPDCMADLRVGRRHENVHMTQTGQGWAEPPDDSIVDPPIEGGYTGFSTGVPDDLLGGK